MQGNAPPGSTTTSSEEDETKSKIEMMLELMGKALYLPRGVISSSDIVSGNHDANFYFLTYLFTSTDVFTDQRLTRKYRDLQEQIYQANRLWKDLKGQAMMAAVASTEAALGTEMMNQPCPTQVAMTARVRF